MTMPVADHVGQSRRNPITVSTSFEIVSKFGVTLATADTEHQARQDVAYRSSRGIAGLTVVEVERTEVRRVVYRPRRVAS